MRPNIVIEAYGHDGSQILGNGEGQGFVRAKQYRRTLAYKSLLGAWRKYPRVAFWFVVHAPSGKLLETIINHEVR